MYDFAASGHKYL